MSDIVRITSTKSDSFRRDDDAVQAIAERSVSREDPKLDEPRELTHLVQDQQVEVLIRKLHRRYL
jgi:hypothetical protein